MKQRVLTALKPAGLAAFHCLPLRQRTPFCTLNGAKIPLYPPSLPWMLYLSSFLFLDDRGSGGSGGWEAAQSPEHQGFWDTLDKGLSSQP